MKVTNSSYIGYQQNIQSKRTVNSSQNPTNQVYVKNQVSFKSGKNIFGNNAGKLLSNAKNALSEKAKRIPEALFKSKVNRLLQTKDLKGLKELSSGKHSETMYDSLIDVIQNSKGTKKYGVIEFLIKKSNFDESLHIMNVDKFESALKTYDKISYIKEFIEDNKAKKDIFDLFKNIETTTTNKSIEKQINEHVIEMPRLSTKALIEIIKTTKRPQSAELAVDSLLNAPSDILNENIENIEDAFNKNKNKKVRDLTVPLMDKVSISSKKTDNRIFKELVPLYSKNQSKVRELGKQGKIQDMMDIVQKNPVKYVDVIFDMLKGNDHQEQKSAVTALAAMDSVHYLNKDSELLNLTLGKSLPADVRIALRKIMDEVDSDPDYEYKWFVSCLESGYEKKINKVAEKSPNLVCTYSAQALEDNENDPYVRNRASDILDRYIDEAGNKSN